MEEDIKLLEEFINLSFLYGKIAFTKTQLYRYQKASANLINRNKELEEENMQLEAIKDEAIKKYNFDSIPKTAIQDKIDVLEKIQKEFKNNEELRIKIITYKELLNKGE